MSPSATEILYGLGVFDRVVAVSDYDAWPPQVSKLPHIGGWSTPNLERVSALHPDLIVLTDAQNGLIGDQLHRLGVPLVALPSETLEDVYKAITMAGKAVGRVDAALKLRVQTHAQLDKVRQLTAPLRRPSVLCVVDRTPGALQNVYVATDRSFLAELIAAAGGRLISPDSTSGYARLGNEELLAMNPDVIIDIVQAPGTQLKENEEKVWSAMPELQALRTHRIAAVREQYVTHASQLVAQTVTLFAHIIHPEVNL